MMPRANSERAALAAAESKDSRFCEITAGRQATASKATVRIELGADISIEIRNADKAMLESYVLEVLAKSC